MLRNVGCECKYCTIYYDRNNTLKIYANGSHWKKTINNNWECFYMTNIIRRKCFKKLSIS